MTPEAVTSKEAVVEEEAAAAEAVVVEAEAAGEVACEHGCGVELWLGSWRDRGMRGAPSSSGESSALDPCTPPVDAACQGK